MSQTKGKILVIRGGAIGDFILTLPVLTALRQQFPGIPIEVLGYPHIVNLAKAGGLADAVHSIEAGSLAGFFARNGVLDERLQEFFGGFAIIVSYLFDPDEIFQTNIGRCSKAQFIAGPHRPDETQKLHATEVFLKPLERLAIFAADSEPHLDFLTGSKRPAKTLAMHPGSGSENKNWPEERWAELLKILLTETELDLLLVGGEVEGGKLQRLAQHSSDSRLQIAQSLPLPELARELAGCTGFVGHDSGISHLAAAVGLPSLVLWGKTAEAVWRPRGRHVSVLGNGDNLGNLSARRVASELSHFIFQVRCA